MSRIVIIGGHGKVALLTAPLLVAAGHDVVSVIRDPAQADDVAATGATPLVLSVEDAGVGELARALAGADAVVWSAGAGGKGGPQRTDAVDRAAAIRSMEAAAAAGVRRYVMVSFLTAYGEVPADHPLRAYAIAKIAADRHLQSTGLDWTILGPGRLTLDAPTGAITVGRLEAGAPTSGGPDLPRQRRPRHRGRARRARQYREGHPLPRRRHPHRPGGRRRAAGLRRPVLSAARPRTNGRQVRGTDKTGYGTPPQLARGRKAGQTTRVNGAACRQPRPHVHTPGVDPSTVPRPGARRPAAPRTHATQRTPGPASSSVRSTP